MAHKSFHGEADDSICRGDVPLKPVSGTVTEIYCDAESGRDPESEDKEVQDGCIYVATTTEVTA
jgi:hypothetical protein